MHHTNAQLLVLGALTRNVRLAKHVLTTHPARQMQFHPRLSLLTVVQMLPMQQRTVGSRVGMMQTVALIRRVLLRLKNVAIQTFKVVPTFSVDQVRGDVCSFVGCTLRRLALTERYVSTNQTFAMLPFFVVNRVQVDTMLSARETSVVSPIHRATVVIQRTLDFLEVQ